MTSSARTWLYENSLTIILLLIFAASMAGQALTGWWHANEELARHGQTLQTLSTYLTSGDFISAVFENWESEFLQMLAFVMLTIWLRQRGSDQSKPIGSADDVDADPVRSAKPNSPGPVHNRGVTLMVYRHSLSLALAMLFAVSFVLHALGSTAKAAEEARLHGAPIPTVAEHLVSASFWFESFQNWQSEFLSIAVFIVLGIWLRQQGSPESKPVAASHRKTGK